MTRPAPTGTTTDWIPMTRIRPTVLSLVLTSTLLGAACGSTTTESTGSSAATEVTEPSTTVADSTTTMSDTTTAADTTTSTLPPVTTAAPAPTTAAPAPTTAAPAPTAAPPTPTAPTVSYCGGAGPLPAGATLVHSVTLDMTGDGSADDLVEAYDVEGWSRLRLTSDGVISEIINPQIDGAYRPLGLAPVLPGDGDELFAVVGEGSAAAEVGVFGVDASGCLFSYVLNSTAEDFTLLIRPASPVRAGATCFDGGIGINNAEQLDDGTWAAYGAAYELGAPGTMQYIGASDDYDEGLTEAELGSYDFDCFGLVL